jgi:hypothetical protein
MHPFIDFRNSCVSNDCAVTLIRETRFPRSKEEHRLLLASLSSRPVHVYCFLSMNLSTAFEQLKTRLKEKGEFLMSIVTVPNLQKTIVTENLGTIVLHGPFNGQLFPRSHRPRSAEWCMAQMKEVVQLFPMDQLKYAFVISDGRYVVWDGDFGRPTRMCCYCNNEKLASLIETYRDRGHLTSVLEPDPSCPRHFICLQCAHRFMRSFSPTFPLPYGDDEECDLPHWPDELPTDWIRSCSHGPCNNLCLPYLSSSLSEANVPSCSTPDQLTSATYRSACCWSSPFIPAEYGDDKCGPPVNGHNGESLRDIRMLDFYMPL